MPALGKKLHHKVARFYLKAWDEQGRDTDEAQIFCLQGGEIRRANARNLAAENHFYRLRELSDRDVESIRELAIADSPEVLKPQHERLRRQRTMKSMSKKAISPGVVHSVPADLRKVLISDATARAKWEDITPLARNEWICWVLSVKKPETRRQHIERVRTELKEGMRRPCCWPGCPHR